MNGAGQTSPQDHAGRARALKAQGRLEEALEHYRLDACLRTQSSVAAHNLASTAGDLSLFEEAAAEAERALSLSRAVPETWLVLARARQGLGHLDEAEQAFAQAIALRADYYDAHHDLAQLRWMRGGELAGATRALDAAIVATHEAQPLVILRSRMDIAAGEPDAAVARLEHALRSAPADPALRLATAQACAAAGRSGAQLSHVVEALRLAPSSTLAASGAVEALLAEGRAEEARDLAERILAHDPRHQGVRALLLTAWRALGDPRGLADYEDTGLIRSLEVATPEGWASREEWLGAVAGVLRARHGFSMHPLGQSLRFGSQTQEDLSRSNDPVIAGLFLEIRRTVSRYIAELGPGSDPTRARAPSPERWRFTGAWSVLLRAGGYHVDHVHPEGWISSALHVETPAASAEPPQGWLAFGRPGIATRPEMAPLHRIRPKAGNLVLFPSYCWHGTEHFRGEEDRLSLAFDVVPI
ncbi:hypothetical protein I5E68_00570 [Novosphingobium sp. YJ-S2-02]|uniref:Tetratricopeptide repeat protein n=1 Tax=Novosphingobium aureum TaxID=2792964 RepID=A0A931MJ48_9SPHN|nr:putative 2OG-Fe(II) oxygenase [Novosphingobium aureum]MBH0111442.1 hypothetical protein [Novosphingobium aureum]